ncbi:hypothetical protein GFS24_11220 [Chitinophaga sp. SYP-B3965]|nr:hypothetical protein [Chitinophaga sp. SYP-B3965]
MVPLNHSNQVLGIVLVVTGGLSNCSVDARLIFFVTALKASATRIILVQNHPSNNLPPSNSDINITLKLTVNYWTFRYWITSSLLPKDIISMTYINIVILTSLVFTGPLMKTSN